MLKGLLKKNEVLQEYVGELKIIYQNEILEIVNYERLVSICDKEVVLDKVVVFGSNLRVIYQDKVQIKIKGQIIKVVKGEENGI